MKCSLDSNVVKEKKFRIAGAVILSVFVITVIVLCSTLLRGNKDDSNSDDNSTNVPSPFSKVLIVQIDNSDLWALDLNTNDSKYLIRNWKNRIHSFDIYKNKTIYIGSSESGEPIKSSSEQYPDVLQPMNWAADKIEVDYVNGKAYTLDMSTSNINIFDLRENYYNIVMSYHRGLKDIALDSARRLMFVLTTSSIERASIDGSSQQTVIATTALSAFTIDYENQVYYADLEDISAVSYAGQQPRNVTKIFHEVISMAALENDLFWLYKSYDSGNSILYSCKIANGSCSGVSTLELSGALLQIKAYKFDDRQISNLCDNRGCQHMCIMNSTDSSRCVCSIGWQLNADLNSCKQADDFLLYMEGDYMKSQILDDLHESFIDAILPIKMNVSLSREHNFDVDVENRMLYFSNEHSMYQMDLRPHGRQIKLTSNDTPSTIIIAIDWISTNLYYTYTEAYQYENTEWFKTHVRVHNMRSVKLFENDLIVHSLSLHNITSMVIHATRGILFYTVIRSEEIVFYPDLAKMYLDGSSHIIYDENLSIAKDRNILGIDCENDRLYWFNKVKDTIHFIDLDGVITVKNISIKLIADPVTMSIYKNWLYICTSKSVWRIDKLSGEHPIKILPQFQQNTQMIFGAKVFSQAIQCKDKTHPCTINNGACQRYCFGVPSATGTLDKVCACNQDEKLNSDGLTCFKKD